MRFTPHQDIHAYERTKRKLKAAERRLSHTPARQTGTAQARNWWQARAELSAIPEPDRSSFIRYWNQREYSIDRRR